MPSKCKRGWFSAQTNGRVSGGNHKLVAWEREVKAGVEYPLVPVPLPDLDSFHSSPPPPPFQQPSRSAVQQSWPGADTTSELHLLRWKSPEQP